MRKPLFYYLTLALFAISLLASCDEEETTKLSMTGSIKYTLPSYLESGTTLDLVASGITEPEEVVYHWWSATELIKDTIDGPNLSFTIPTEPGEYSLTCYSSCDGYYDAINTQYTTVINPSFNGTIKGIVKGDSIKDSRDNNWYYYSTIGQLDWFTENLRYLGTGKPYALAEPISLVIGNLYSWNDATGGVSASGLGAGPKGACPDGWSVPTKEDWEDLAKTLNNGTALSFDDKWEGLGGKVTAEIYFNGEKMWPYSPDNAKENLFGWNAIPAGNSKDSYVRFQNLFSYGMWWSSTQKSDDQASYRYIFYNQSLFAPNDVDKSSYGVSVRCVRLAQ